MCGITGIYSFENSVHSYEKFLHKSLSLLNKRGPDFSGSHFFSHFAAAHSRLSIIDTSSLANQPFVDPSGRYMLVFNGEIFNYKDLRSYLTEKYQITFSTQSDTEVLLHILIQEGKNSIQKLIGFWAFAFYDNLSGTCLIARDRLGKKPLWYTMQNSFFCFASEFKALHAFPIQKTLDPKSIALFFRLSYLPSPYTPFSNIHKLDPGTYIEISKDGSITQQRYYSIPFYDKPFPYSYQQAQDKLLELVHNSVSTRLVSDVPMGAFLSGGLDSAVVAAIAKEHKPDLQTFCLAFPELAYLNESDYAQETADFIGTNHHTLPVYQSDMLNAAHEVLDYTDDLYADSSAIAMQALCKTVRPYCTVALSGDGGDEVFGGYRKHQAMALALQYHSFNVVASLLRPLSRSLPSSRSSEKGDRIRKIQKFIELLAHPTSKFYNYTLEWFHADFVAELLLFSNEKLAVNNRIDAFKHSSSASVNEWLYADLSLLLQGDMLPKVDLFSMQNSMEIRNPLLDQSLINFAASIATEFKVDTKYRKRILFDTFANHLPPNMKIRPKKGFEVPLHHWMKNDWKDLMQNEWLNPVIIKEQGVLNLNKIQSLQKQLHSGSSPDAHYALWNAIVFTKWYSTYN